MILTAQRVRSPTGHEDINAFCHLHGPYDWDGAAPEEIGPGELVSSVVRVEPGGNSVRSYLDIVAPDETPTSEIASAVGPFVVRNAGCPLPWTGNHGRCTFRFGLDLGLEHRWTEELTALLAAALDVRRPY
jgi:hypothetical protein